MGTHPAGADVYTRFFERGGVAYRGSGLPVVEVDNLIGSGCRSRADRVMFGTEGQLRDKFTVVFDWVDGLAASRPRRRELYGPAYHAFFRDGVLNRDNAAYVWLLDGFRGRPVSEMLLRGPSDFPTLSINEPGPWSVLQPERAVRLAGRRVAPVSGRLFERASGYEAVFALERSLRVADTRLGARSTLTYHEIILASKSHVASLGAGERQHAFPESFKVNGNGYSYRDAVVLRLGRIAPQTVTARSGRVHKDSHDMPLLETLHFVIDPAAHLLIEVGGYRTDLWVDVERYPVLHAALRAPWR